MFAQTPIGNKKAIMKVKGKIYTLLINIDPTLYTKSVTMDNGQYLIYVDLLKYLYGFLKVALLFYKKIVKGLKDIVLKLIRVTRLS